MMRLTRSLKFILQFAVLGLAVAFIVTYLLPDNALNPGGNPVVEVREAPSREQPVRNSGPVSYADAVETAAPAVVNIHTKKLITREEHPLLDDPLFRRFFGEEFGGPREREETNLGSGVIISDQGYILTSNHVIDGAEEIQIALPDQRSASATVVGTDPDTDLAVLKVELDNLPVITLGRSDQLRVGDVVLAIGNPFGVGQTVTSGIVSATGRNMLGINTFENFIQTDAAINPGNSGGALITAGGDLIGINTAIFSRSGGSQGIGFAIPTSLARDVMQQIIEHGEVKRGWIGVAIQGINDNLAESLNLDEDQKGVIITRILNNGPADRAGLKPGDVITRIENQPVTDVASALDLISSTRPGSKIRIQGLRQNDAFERTVKAAQRPKQDEQ
ncbi:trypsin-like peptidase domain-containing protein [Thiohalophilus thiocyanatoxydans]|uniref:Serine protease DegS n=1 Tax=Thiohalophilus thiocyanatoxydans TaxID=381308 RepID=A0A4R8ITX8_9GAMM|nr:trypsin-like peptidase domain-containing protein [Thiohalophilus thiocyanatoxydans]TDY01127.1 serine protease DegS [Thiohalophilus thiocyanatoxydans]